MNPLKTWLKCKCERKQSSWCTSFNFWLSSKLSFSPNLRQICIISANLAIFSKPVHSGHRDHTHTSRQNTEHKTKASRQKTGAAVVWILGTQQRAAYNQSEGWATAAGTVTGQRKAWLAAPKCLIAGRLSIFCVSPPRSFLLFSYTLKVLLKRLQYDTFICNWTKLTVGLVLLEYHIWCYLHNTLFSLEIFQLSNCINNNH